MTFEKTELAPDDEVIRLFARSPSEIKKNKRLRVRAADFDRSYWMSGISMHRARAKEEARKGWNTNWPKGILIAKAAPLLKLGLDFYHTGKDHFSVRCTGCDLSQYQRDEGPLCKKADGGICDFSPLVVQALGAENIIPLAIRDNLAKIFTIDVAPY